MKRRATKGYQASQPDESIQVARWVSDSSGQGLVQTGYACLRVCLRAWREMAPDCGWKERGAQQ